MVRVISIAFQNKCFLGYSHSAHNLSTWNEINWSTYAFCFILFLLFVYCTSFQRNGNTAFYLANCVFIMFVKPRGINSTLLFKIHDPKREVISAGDLLSYNNASIGGMKNRFHSSSVHLNKRIAFIVLMHKFNRTTLEFTDSNFPTARTFHANPIRVVCPSDVLFVVVALILDHLLGLFWWILLRNLADFWFEMRKRFKEWN